MRTDKEFTIEPKVLSRVLVYQESATKYIANFSNGEEVIIRRKCTRAGVLKDFKKVGDKFLAEYWMGDNLDHYTQHSLSNPNENTGLLVDSFFFMKEKGEIIVYHIPKESKIQVGKTSSPQEGQSKKTIYFS